MTVDDALRGQGADPEQLRARRPSIVERAEAALTMAQPLLHPVVLHREFRILAHGESELELEDGAFLRGRAVATRLAEAKRLVVAVCTVGEALEVQVACLFREDPATALVLDGIGSAAVDSLAAQACRRFKDRARAAGLRGAVHCRPGSLEWPTEEAQPQIFDLLDQGLAVGDEVRLLPSLIMQPLKSLTLVLGFTAAPVPAEHECDACAVGGTCRYRSAARRDRDG